MAERSKPTVESLGIDLEALTWHRSGGGQAESGTPGELGEGRTTDAGGAATGSIEVAFAGEWVLLRVAGDSEQRVLVYDHREWDAFLDGAKRGEFDDAV